MILCHFKIRLNVLSGFFFFFMVENQKNTTKTSLIWLFEVLSLYLPSVVTLPHTAHRDFLILGFCFVAFVLIKTGSPPDSSDWPRTPGLAILLPPGAGSWQCSTVKWNPGTCLSAGLLVLSLPSTSRPYENGLAFHR